MKSMKNRQCKKNWSHWWPQQSQCQAIMNGKIAVRALGGTIFF